MRLSSYAYTLDKLNYYIHLTNNAVQQTSPMYGDHIAGNIISIRQLELYARETGGLQVEEGHFMKQI